MQLTVNGHVLPVSQLGPDFLILKNPIAPLLPKPKLPLGSMGNQSWSWRSRRAMSCYGFASASITRRCE